VVDWRFLLGFLGKVSVRRGVFVDRLWCFVWQRWTSDAHYFLS
jgi:hypothetical protein